MSVVYQFLLTISKFLVDTSAGSSVENSSDVLDPTYKALDIIMPVALGLVLTVGTLFIIILGVQYSRAESADDRGKVKKKLINSIIGFVVILLLVSILYAIRGTLADFINGYK